MHNKKIFIFLSGLLLFISCNSRKEQIPLDIETETIDFWSFKKINGIISESIIKDTKYILLDNSNDDILFQGIDKVKIVNNIIYILDQRLKKLVVFDSMGVGIGKVGQIGQGPEEYLQISDFDVNDAGDIYFIDGTTGADRLFVFDKNLQFVSRKQMPFEADIIHCLPNNKLLFGLSSWNKGKNVNKKIVITDTDMKTEQSYMKYDEYHDDSYWISDYAFVSTGDNILYNKPIDNFVYQFSKNGVLAKAYLFDFGKKNVPNEDKKDIEGNNEKYKNYCCLKNFTVIDDKYILGTLRDELKTKPFIIDRKNKELFIGKEVISGDISNIAGFYDNRIISFIYPGKYENIETTNLPENVKQYVADENFVLCINELK
ncbi:hypothetical protein AGMMS50262_05860 [Bacteroidia bacterium]|nr:hypothetical protein AGMMS50262_05860 [Bacteroidia bacterium]